jgi:cell division protein FtsB
MGERPFHHDYQHFRPAGSMGLLFGVIGSAMMLILLLYSLRKRTRIFGRLFALRHWLDVHIWFGICGPLFILLHTSFRLGGLVAVSFWSMAIVAASGVFGRYLYTQIPHNKEGEEIEMDNLDGDEQTKLLDRLSRSGKSLKQRMMRLNQIRRLFHYWHIIHRPLALIMYIVMFIHIVVALLFGISWRSSE